MMHFRASNNSDLFYLNPRTWLTAGSNEFGKSNHFNRLYISHPHMYKCTCGTLSNMILFIHTKHVIAIFSQPHDVYKLNLCYPTFQIMSFSVSDVLSNFFCDFNNFNSKSERDTNQNVKLLFIFIENLINNIFSITGIVMFISI